MTKPIIDVPGIKNPFLRRLWVPVLFIVMTALVLVVWPFELALKLLSAILVALSTIVLAAAESLEGLIEYFNIIWGMCVVGWKGRE